MSVQVRYVIMSYVMFLSHAHPDFLNLALHEGRIRDGLSGACVIVTHVAGRTVRTANAGDCRTIIGRRIKHSNGTITYKAIELSQDHQIDTNQKER